MCCIWNLQSEALGTEEVFQSHSWKYLMGKTKEKIIVKKKE